MQRLHCPQRLTRAVTAGASCSGELDLATFQGLQQSLGLALTFAELVDFVAGICGKALPMYPGPPCPPCWGGSWQSEIPESLSAARWGQAACQLHNRGVMPVKLRHTLNSKSHQGLECHSKHLTGTRWLTGLKRCLLQSTCVSAAVVGSPSGAHSFASPTAPRHVR